MELESITCGNCGGPLQVPAGLQFVTCNYCHSSLQVHRGESATYTEKIEQIDARTQDMAVKLAQLRYDSELAQIDRAWERERQTYMIKSKDGQMIEPSAAASIAAGVLAVAFGIFWLATVPAWAGAEVRLGGLLVVALAIPAAIYSYSKSRELESARKRYRHRRSRLSVNSFLSDGTDTNGDASNLQSDLDFLKPP